MDKIQDMFEKDGFVFIRETTKDGDSIEKYCFRAVHVSRVFHDFVTKKVELELSYMYDGEEKLLRFSRSIMTKNEILRTLPAYGIDVTDLNVLLFLQWLSKEERQATISYIHQKLGWHSIGDEKVWLLDKAISKGGNVLSTYAGNLKISSVGTLKDHLQLIASEVKGNTALEFAYVAGLSSILVGFIKEYTNIPVIIIHFFGNSSTGKSTCLQLGLSPFGLTSKAKNGLMLTWYSTPNSIVGFLKDKNGFTFALDESSSRVGDSSSQIYTFSEGLTKGRADVDGNIKEFHEFSGALFSSGEGPLLQEASHNEGLRVRLFEISLKQFTASAENSKAIQRGLQRSYGHSARIFAKHLLEVGEAEVITRFLATHKLIMERFRVRDKFSDRTADRISIIYLTGVMANECLGIDFDMDSVLDLLLQVEEESIEERDLGEKAYRILIDYVTMEPNSFYRWQKSKSYLKSHDFKETLIHSQKIKGRIDFDGAEANVIYYQKDLLDEILRENGFQSPQVVIKALKDKQLLYMDKSGKSQINRQLYPTAAGRTRVYGIILKGTSTLTGDQDELKDAQLSDEKTSELKLNGTTKRSEIQMVSLDDSVAAKRTIIPIKSQRKKRILTEENINSHFDEVEDENE